MPLCFMHVFFCPVIYYPRMKGGIHLSSTGYIQFSAYESNAQIPIKDVSIILTAADGTLLATRLTDRSGRTAPYAITVPDRSESLTPDPAETPFTTVNLIARKDGYELIDITAIQIFADTTTNQNLEFIPLSELPEMWDRTEQFETNRQNL